MKYIIYKLQHDKYYDIKNEIMFNIACARAAGAELIRFDISDYVCGNSSAVRKAKFAVKILKNMKAVKKIQFFAAEEAFTEKSVEAEYLYNKYPEYIKVSKENDSFSFVYVKL